MPTRPMPTRDDAWALLYEYTASENLRKHALAVESCLRAYARKADADEHLWGLTALLHDFDYQRWPNQEHHPTEGHAYTGLARETPLDHVLFACDEMAGFLTACALVKPGKTIFEVEPDSVKRKMKDKAFAKGVSREDLKRGAQELGLSLDDHIATCIAAMRDVAHQLGLESKPTL